MTKEFNKEEYNKMCAEFMEIQYSELHKGELTTSQSKSEWMCTYANLQYEDARDDFPFLKPIDYLKFDSDWNWIMEVVEKIESIGFNFNLIKNGDNYAEIRSSSCYDEKVSDSMDLEKEYISKKEAVVHAIWEFLNLYKENKE